MQSNQLSDGVIIKITTTPISVKLSAFYLHYLICPHASRGRRVHCPERREGLTPVPRVLGPGPRSQAQRASCWGGGTGRGVRGPEISGCGGGSQDGKGVSSSLAGLPHSP